MGMPAPARSAIVLLVVGLSTIALAGCDLLAPTRDGDGRIVKATVMPSTDAVVGDCFSFIDGTDFAQATVIPCAEAHTYIVIDQGSFSADEITTAGSAQNAVTAACEEVFKVFLADADDGVKREQQFIVSQDEGVTDYSCLATDSIAVAEG